MINIVHEISPYMNLDFFDLVTEIKIENYIIIYYLFQHHNSTMSTIEPMEHDSSIYYINLYGQKFLFEKCSYNHNIFGKRFCIRLPTHGDMNCSCRDCQTDKVISAIKRIHKVDYVGHSHNQHSQTPPIYSEEMQKTADKAMNIIRIYLPAIKGSHYSRAFTE